ncbi:MAG TPA: hypothetical protein VF121_14440 [Thermoanaerobaculia bacterium]|nr:hypothetical protein [Thermoanaerobaculia bacterium]
MAPTPEQLEIARLEAQVAALEAALDRRSRQLRTLQERLCARDLALLARLESGLPPLPSGPFDPDVWRETTALTGADVEETLDELWRSLAPPDAEPDDR